MYFPYDLLNILFSLAYFKNIAYNTYNMQNVLSAFIIIKSSSQQ